MNHQARHKMQYDLFTVQTEGIKYAGSKLKLIPGILEAVRKSISSGGKVLDGFSGTTRVSQALAQSGHCVTSSDVSEWSYIFGNCYLKAKPSKQYTELINHLNNVKPYDGWFTANYGGTENDQKYLWQAHNTKKLDGIRQEIDNLELNQIDKSVALASLILALDKVDNTLGHFSSYLKEWAPRSYNDMKLKVPSLIGYDQDHEVIKGDIFEVIKDREFDLVYFDPPYGSNNEKMPPSRVRYCSYYHIWTTICLNDQPKLFGVANRREDTRDSQSSSVFEEFRKNQDGSYIAVNAIRKLLNEVQSKYIVLSYSSGGRATANELTDAINATGKLINIHSINYKKNVMSNMKWTNDWAKEETETNVEFIFHIKKN